MAGWAFAFKPSRARSRRRSLSHVRLWDKENVQEQEALGIFGVNLIHGALYLHGDPPALIESLVDNVGSDRIEVDMIQFSGPAFAKLDNRLMALQLVQSGLTNAALFTSDGQVMQPADALYKKCIMVERGSFRPVTKVTLDMLRCAQAQFVQEPNVQGEEVLTLMEMTLKNLTDGDKIDPQDFLDRVDSSRRAGQDGADFQFRRIPPPGRLFFPLHQENDRHRHGRADVEGDF